MAAIFKDGRQMGIKLLILNVRVAVVDNPDISITKNAQWIGSAFWYSYLIWLMDYYCPLFFLRKCCKTSKAARHPRFVLNKICHY